MPEQKLTWGQIPESIKLITCTYGKMQKTFQLQMANEIMSAMKAEMERAWTARTETRYKDHGDSYESIVIYDFETWYKNAYLK